MGSLSKPAHRDRPSVRPLHSAFRESPSSSRQTCCGTAQNRCAKNCSPIGIKISAAFSEHFVKRSASSLLSTLSDKYALAPLGFVLLRPSQWRFQARSARAECHPGSDPEEDAAERPMRSFQAKVDFIRIFAPRCFWKSSGLPNNCRENSNTCLPSSCNFLSGNLILSLM